MSNGQAGITWRFLIVEDKEDKIHQLQEIAPACVEAPDQVEVVVCPTFNKAANHLRTGRFDLLILDLKDDSDTTSEADSNPAGLAVFEELKKTRFLPVVFYTALAHKVRSQETSFVRVVEKTEDVTRVKEEVRRVFATQLPALTRRLEELERSYMWDFVSTHWKEFVRPADQADIAYLLTRRLAISLEAAAGLFAAAFGGASTSDTTGAKTHPMVMYIVPPMGPHHLAGDIISETVEGQEQYWLVLTPSCDFAQAKAEHVTLAKCERLVDREEAITWLKTKSNTSTERFERLIEDNRGERFKFLPSAYFMPDLVADFQQLRSLSSGSLNNFKRVATLDSPFAESVVARFSRYCNRLGTPDIDKALVINRFQANLKTTTPEAAPAPNEHLAAAKTPVVVPDKADTPPVATASPAAKAAAPPAIASGPTTVEEKQVKPGGELK